MMAFEVSGLACSSIDSFVATMMPQQGSVAKSEKQSLPEVGLQQLPMDKRK
jgi:hypothetical protein